MWARELCVAAMIAEDEKSASPWPYGARTSSIILQNPMKCCRKLDKLFIYSNIAELDVRVAMQDLPEVEP